MPEKKTIEARKAKREGKSPSTQAGEFVHEEIEHIREGKHGARSAKQAIAIGLSKARRAGVKLPPPLKSARNARSRAQARQRPRRQERAVAGALASGEEGAKESRERGLDDGPVAAGQGAAKRRRRRPQGGRQEGRPDARPTREFLHPDGAPPRWPEPERKVRAARA